MYDYGLSTLEQYHLTARASWRTRGALCVRRKKGLILREFNGSEKKSWEGSRSFCRSFRTLDAWWIPI